MNKKESSAGRLMLRAGGCLLLATALAACAGNVNPGGTDNRASSPSGQSGDRSNASSQTASDDGSASSTQEEAAGGRNAEVCRKYDSCGCQKYDECMASLENDPYIDQPGIRECLLKSSCGSLCANRADGCSGSNAASNPSTVPRQTNCAAIHCGQNSDCPTECYGGCGDSRVCLSF